MQKQNIYTKDSEVYKPLAIIFESLNCNNNFWVMEITQFCLTKSPLSETMVTNT